MMKVMIPYKEISTRCKDKNLKEFHDGKSILDISVDFFKKYNYDIHLACIPSDTSKKRAKYYDVKTLDLPDKDTGWSNMVFHIAESMEETCSIYEPIIFWLATDISIMIANDLNELIQESLCHIFSGWDSIIFGSKFNNFLVDSTCYPKNFSAGAWHPYSQNLEELYQISATAITSIRVMKEYRYTWGPKSIVKELKEPVIDINNEEQFKLAQLAWAHWND